MFTNFRLSTLSFVLAVSGMVLSGSCLAAEGHEEDVHLDPGLQLSSLLEATLARQPQVGVLKAEQATADAEIAYGKHWFPESLELGGFHLSDRQFDDIGAYENEVALSIPLWLPGEKKAQTLLGDAASTASVSSKREYRWRVSGVLRKQLWVLMTARRQWELALDQEQYLSDLLEQVTLFTEAGDLSRSDQLATLQEFAVWKAETMKLEAEFQDAAREYRALTGFQNVPADISETLSEVAEIHEDHPALQSALDRLAAESAAIEVIRQGNSSRPSMQVFWRGYAGDRASPEVNAVGLGLVVPLGQSPRRRPEIARSNEGLAKAEADLLVTRRRLDLQLHEARHLLKVTEMQLANSDTMIKAANERHRLDQLAFELGEFGVREWLRRLVELKKIQRSHELLQMQKGIAIASYNQAVGKIL